MGRRGLTSGKSTRKTRSHEAIVATAAKLLRENGTDGVSVDGLMADAGMTRGGFYAHFDDKEALVVAALERAFDEQRAVLIRDGVKGRALLEGMLARYLSREHLEHPGLGCPVPPLAGEIARAPKAVKAVFRTNLLRLVRLMSERIGKDEDEMLAVCAMAVGAVTIARAVGDEEIAMAMLAAARRHLLRIRTPRARARRRLK
jgi:TetR/AcrR family transcriptional repressor of nem operon